MSELSPIPAPSPDPLPPSAPAGAAEGDHVVHRILRGEGSPSPPADGGPKGDKTAPIYAKKQSPPNEKIPVKWSIVLIIGMAAAPFAYYFYSPESIRAREAFKAIHNGMRVKVVSPEY